MKPILITGAGGLLGANLVVDCARLGLPVSGIDRSVCDLTDAAMTTRVIREIEPSHIIHTAALTHVDWCENHPEETWHSNVDASRTLAQIAQTIGAGIVYISTDSVFDGARGFYGEADDPRPLNVYAKSKLAGERAVLAEAPDALIVRTVIYGWNLRAKRSFAEWILSHLTAGSEVPGFDDAVFSPILVNDLGRLLLALLERRASGVCHVAAGEAWTKFEFARAVAKTFGFNPAQVRRASLRSAAMIAPRPLNTSLDTSYASRLLGTALPRVWEGLARFREAAQGEYACV
ncbi:MAG TPA: SDR family oxidoreductase [Bryobacteraceae bacterium]|nr:SDR family oxidoreductase [Bryobacteraceae bacterium]